MRRRDKDRDEKVTTERKKRRVNIGGVTLR